MGLGVACGELVGVSGFEFAGDRLRTPDIDDRDRGPAPARAGQPCAVSAGVDGRVDNEIQLRTTRLVVLGDVAVGCDEYLAEAVGVAGREGVFGPDHAPVLPAEIPDAPTLQRRELRAVCVGYGFRGLPTEAVQRGVDAPEVQRYRVEAENGWVEAQPAFNVAADAPATLEYAIDGEADTETFEPVDQYAEQVTAFADCVDSGAEPRTGGREAIANMRVIDALYESAERGAPVDVA